MIDKKTPKSPLTVENEMLREEIHQLQKRISNYYSKNQQLEMQIETSKLKENAYRDWLMAECDSNVWNLKEVNEALKKFLEVFGETET